MTDVSTFFLMLACGFCGLVSLVVLVSLVIALVDAVKERLQ